MDIARASRRGGAAALVLWLLAAVALPARADEPGESDQASVLVRQAIALIVNTPNDMEGIEDKIKDAQEVKNQEGVKIELVEQAGEALEQNDMHRVRSLLEQSIGARPHLGGADVPPIRETSSLASGALATGEQTGTNVAIDPLEPKRGLDGGAWVMLAVSLGLILLGAWLALRWRPPRHREA
jgi:hypothetical protein